VFWLLHSLYGLMGCWEFSLSFRDADIAGDRESGGN
jgi:hypothetical protein